MFLSPSLFDPPHSKYMVFGPSPLFHLAFVVGQAIRATSRRPRLGYPAGPSVADRSAGSTRFCISSKRTPALTLAWRPRVRRAGPPASRSDILPRCSLLVLPKMAVRVARLTPD
jgi:hypothetical protein